MKPDEVRDATNMARRTRATRYRRLELDTWFRPLALGEPLPSLPLWLSETERISLDLEASYEETCRVLRIAGQS